MSVNGGEEVCGGGGGGSKRVMQKQTISPMSGRLIPTVNSSGVMSESSDTAIY